MNRIVVAVAMFWSLLAVPSIVIGQVRWKSAGVGALPAGTPQQAAGAVRQIVADGKTKHLVLHFSKPIDEAAQSLLAAAGVDLLASLEGNAYFAVVKDGARDPQALGRISTLQAAERIQQAFKLHPMIANNDWPPYSIVSREIPDREQPGDIVAIYALFHADVPMARGVSLARKHGATVQGVLDTINALVLELPRGQVAAFADRDEVQWIEPPLPPLDINNDSNRVVTQANTVQAAPYSLNGNGVSVMVYDAGTARSTHNDFGGRCTVRDASGTIDHATHVAGTIGGSGAASGGTFRGMAPGVTIESYGFQYDGSGTFLYTNPGDLQADYNQAINTFGADISNNSIGTNTESNGFPCSIQGDYGVTDQLIDSVVRGSLGAPFRVVWANGNERQGTRCNVEGFGSYYSTAPPACAKNHIAIGAINSNDESMTSFSSWGPVDDGRIKPDVSAPGCQSNGDFGVTSSTAASNTSYGSFCGTSMAAPTTTGLCALLLQDFRVQFVGQPDPRNSTLKILLAHNAADLGNVGPDYQFGYGSVRIQNTIDFMRTGNFFESSVSGGGTVNTSVNVAPGSPTLKITLAWDDAPGTPNVVPSLVNDLDLVVISPSSVRAYPWTLNPASPSTAAVRTQEDHLNNIEQVLVNSPESGVWTIQVVGTSVPQGPQPFSICASPNIAVPAAVNVVLPNGAPTLISPNTATNINVVITTINDTLVPGSPTMHYRFGGVGSYQTASLTPLGGNNYSASLPGTGCSAAPEFYFSAAGTSVGTVTNPPTAPASVYSAAIGEFNTVFADDMEANLGWTVGDTGDSATTGVWTRVNPVGTDAQPEDDHTANPASICWVTGQGIVGGGLGDNDVDGGKTTLVSPTIDLSSGDATISYYRWYSNNTGAEPNADTFRVDISNANGGAGTWVNVETVGPSGAGTGGGWIYHEFDVSSIVTPTSQIRLRFIAEDAAGGSLIEAGLDDFNVEQFTCEGEPDLLAPSPDPMSFAISPNPAGTSAVLMQATAALDADTPPVQYLFEETTGTSGGSSSSWQASVDYTDTGLLANSIYAYRVAARDSFSPPNQTSWSATLSATTFIEQPTAIIVGNVTTSSVELTAVGPFTNLTLGGSGLFFDSTTAGGDGGLNVWTQSTATTATSLQAAKEYTFRVKARNRNGIETAYGPSVSVRTKRLFQQVPN